MRLLEKASLTAREVITEPFTLWMIRAKVVQPRERGKTVQLSSNVCRLESGTGVSSHSYGRVPGEGVDVERGSREYKGLDASSDQQIIVNASVSRYSLHEVTLGQSR